MKRNIISRLTFLQNLIDGIGKHLSSATSITLAGTPYPPAAIEKLLQELIDAINAGVAARTAARDAVRAEREKARALDPLIQALKSYLLGVYSDAGTLADFGLAPRKPRRVLTQSDGAASVEKRRATRDARHTLGKRQKLRIKGSVAPPTTGGPATPPGGAAASANAPKP